MISARWRQRLFYGAASIFIVVHVVTLLIGPMPDSVMKQAVLGFLHPYVAPLRLANTWDFYAPGIGYGTHVRYTVEDAAGQSHVFTPAAEINWFDPLYWWSSQWYKYVVNHPDDYTAVAAALLCRKHAALRPVAITFAQIEQTGFAVTDHLEGQHPVDPEHYEENKLERIECHNP